jgi:hypothetical protein
MSGLSRADLTLRSCKSCGTPMTEGYPRLIVGHQGARRLCRECAERLDRRRRGWARPLASAVAVLALFAACATAVRATLGPLTAEGLFLSAAVALVPVSWSVLRGKLLW